MEKDFTTDDISLYYVMRCAICHHLHNLKNIKNTHGRLILLQPETLLKVTLLHGSFSRFLNCTNGTKLRKASHVVFYDFKLQGKYS